MRAAVIDDDRTIRETLSEILMMEGFDTVSFGNIKESVAYFADESADLVISDQRLPDGTGLDILQMIKEKNPETDVFIITGWGNIELAVEAMRRGAVDFLTKPLDMNALIGRIRTWRRSKAEKKLLTKNQSGIFQKWQTGIFEGVRGTNPKMLKAIELMEKVAPSDVAVLVRGETGTGKELIAKGLHKGSLRKDSAFIMVNCAAIPDSLLESELFGYEKGAFTGASTNKKGKFLLAQGGTIFLDEIGDMSFNTQAKLLRVLQDRKLEPLGSEKIFDLDVRVVTATNRNLEEMVKEGSFRQDLYYRLNVVSIFLPSLTERQEDIKEIALYLLEQFSQKHKLDVPDIDDTVWDIFRSYTWPGNIRELGNIIERALLLSDGVLIRPMDISLPDIRTAIMYSDETKDLRKTVEVIEKDKLEQALAESGGNQVKAAMMLGIKRTTLRYKLQKYKLLAA